MACSNGISVFFSMPPPLPSSTLFPYTTLFRSQELSPAVKPRHHRPDRNAHHLGDLFIGEPLERKSTRLNSSHRCISYAVSCLKKKISTVGACGAVNCNDIA